MDQTKAQLVEMLGYTLGRVGLRLKDFVDLNEASVQRLVDSDPNPTRLFLEFNYKWRFQVNPQEVSTAPCS